LKNTSITEKFLFGGSVTIRKLKCQLFLLSSATSV
jgi:hypothetical protein